MAIFRRNRQTQNLTNTITNENIFSPNLTNNIALEGLDALGGFIRDGFNRLASVNSRQVDSIDQAGLNLSGAIDGAGLNVRDGLVESSANLGGAVRGLGANIGFAIIGGSALAVVGRAAFRG